MAIPALISRLVVSDTRARGSKEYAHSAHSQDCHRSGLGPHACMQLADYEDGKDGQSEVGGDRHSTICVVDIYNLAGIQAASGLCWTPGLRKGPALEHQN